MAGYSVLVYNVVIVLRYRIEYRVLVIYLDSCTEYIYRELLVYICNAKYC